MYRSYGMLTNTNNIFYHFYMGNKYLLNGDLIGYHKIKDGIYENDDVLSVGYVTDKIMGENEYNSLNYFEKVDAYLNYAIVPYNKNFVYEKKIVSVTVETGTVSCPLPHSQYKKIYKRNKKMFRWFMLSY